MERILNQKKITYDLVLTERVRQAWEVAAERGGRYGRVIAAGGDGTIHEVINGLLQARQATANALSGPRIGFIPIGSGNDFVKAVNIPADILLAVEVIEKGSTRRIDIGQICINETECRYFNNNVGVGFDARVNYETQKIKALRGLAAYLSAVLKTVFTYQHPFVRYETDGVWREQSILLIHTGNGTCSGGGFYLTPDARPDDGWLDVCVINSMSALRILKELPKAMDGSHTRVRGVTMHRTKHIRIESAQPLPVHADGEMLSLRAQTISLTMIPQMLEIIVNGVSMPHA